MRESLEYVINSRLFYYLTVARRSVMKINIRFIFFVSAIVFFAEYCGSVEHYETTENPHEVFSMSTNHSNKVTISFVQAGNVQATCDAESKKRGLGGFLEAVEACSFWSASKVGNECTIVTAKKTNYHTLGHEVRHCLQGNFHK